MTGSFCFLSCLSHTRGCFPELPLITVQFFLKKLKKISKSVKAEGMMEDEYRGPMLPLAIYLDTVIAQ